MATTHPYISGAGNIANMVNHLRNAFPPVVSADTLKKLSIAPKNESYVINALQFTGVIDEEGKQTVKASEVFNLHKDEDFQVGFKAMVKDAYSELFELHGDAAWELEKNDLIGFFRQSDKTSNIIGSRQAAAFIVFKALCGYGEVPITKQTKAPDSTKKPTSKKKTVTAIAPIIQNKTEKAAIGGSSGEVELSVKIEINLPSDATAETYDNIFQSIRKHLMNG